MNKLDKFEEQIKNSLEGYEMPYDASQWAKFEQKLNASSSPKGGKGLWYVAAGTAAVIAVSAVIYFTNNGNEPELNNNNKTIVESEIKSNNQINKPDNTIITDNNADVPFKANQNNIVNNQVTTNVNEQNRRLPELVNNNIPIAKENASNPNTLSTDNNSANGNNNNNGINPQHEPAPINLANVKPSITVDKTTVCAGEKFILKLEQHPAKIDLGNGEIVSLNANEKKQISFNESGVYNIHVADMPEISQTITVLPKPEANIAYNTAIEDGRQVTRLYADSYLNTNLIWYFHDGKTSNEKNTWKYYNKKGTYPVKLAIEGNNGCKNEISKQIVIEEDYNLLAPNIFSPNGDGINETFIPEALKILNVSFVMTVYDRSGKLVYSTNTVDKPWDGRYTSDNKLAPAGVYIWVVKMIDDKGNAETFKGDVRLD